MPIMDIATNNKMLSCDFQTNIYIFLVPTAPRELQIHSHVEILDKQTNGLYIVMKWKPPVYTGDSIFAYDFRVKGHTSKKQAYFSFEYFHFHLILERRDDDWIYSSPIFVVNSLHQEIVVSARNDAGLGQPAEILTDGE